jgi:predicted metal-dependent HD superfamily phosphohydrolase
MNTVYKEFLPHYQKWYIVGVRQYHNVTHANEVADYCINNGASQAVILAAMYHDAVYNPGSDMNEEESAMALEIDYRHVRGITGKNFGNLIDRAKFLIRHTRVSIHLHSEWIKDPELALILDADLIGLGCEYPKFLENQKNILRENQLSDTELHLSANFLSKFLTCRDIIYHTANARELFELRARENINKLCKEIS